MRLEMQRSKTSAVECARALLLGQHVMSASPVQTLAGDIARERLTGVEKSGKARTQTCNIRKAAKGRQSVRGPRR